MVRLQVSSTQPRIRRYVNRLDRLFSYEPVDTQVVGVAGGRPQFTEAKTGLNVEKGGMAKAITRALASTNRRRPIELIVSTVEPKVTPANYGPVVIIHRGAKGSRSSTARLSCAGSGWPPAALDTRHRSAPTASRRSR